MLAYYWHEQDIKVLSKKKSAFKTFSNLLEICPSKAHDFKLKITVNGNDPAVFQLFTICSSPDSNKHLAEDQSSR